MLRTALLVPCYNAVRFLPRLAEQLAQLRPAFDEVLLANDASQDDTLREARRLGFRITDLPSNLGPGGARNALAAAATAEWIHFHDVDDEIAPDYLAAVLPYATADCDFVLHHTDFIDEESRQLVTRWHVDSAELARDPATALLLHPFPTMSSFLRRATFLAAGGFHEQRRCFEDGDLHFRLAAGGAHITHLPRVLEWSLRHGAGAGSNQRYCFQCRLGFLQDYAANQPAALHAAIAAEAERTAGEALGLGDRPTAAAALQLARRLGRAVPTSNHPLLSLARTFLPATTLLGWQLRHRHSRPTPGGFSP